MKKRPILFAVLKASASSILALVIIFMVILRPIFDRADLIGGKSRWGPYINDSPFGILIVGLVIYSFFTWSHVFAMLKGQDDPPIKTAKGKRRKKRVAKK